MSKQGMKYISVIFLLMTGIVSHGYSQDIVEGVALALSKGDSKTLVTYFSQSVDIGLPDKDQEYRKAQGGVVMDKFFRQHPPDKFIVEQDGTTDTMTKFFIGKYITGDLEYQVLVILKKEEDKYLVHKIKFEKEEQ